MVTVPFVREAMETTRLSGAQWVLLVVGAVAGGGWLEVVSAARFTRRMIY